MRFLVLVEPDPHEPQILSKAEALDGLQWLCDKHEDGILPTMPEAYVKDDGTPITGGYMFAEVPDRAALDALMDTYPMRHTITYTARAVGDLRTGFRVLVDAIENGRTVDA